MRDPSRRGPHTGRIIHRQPAPGLSVVGAFWRGRTPIAHRRYHRRMTDDLFRADAYLRACEARILRIDEAGIVLDREMLRSELQGILELLKL